MESISPYYPKKEIHVIDYGITAHIINIFIHNQKSYMINVCSYKNFPKTELFINLKKSFSKSF